MPPESVWTMLFKVVIPTILGAGLGAGLALYGVRQTNKHNTAENAANREHQLRLETAKAEIAAKYKSQDNRWEFRKDVYVNLIEATSDMIGRDLEIVETFRSDGPQTDKSRQMLEKAFAAHGLAAQTFVTYCNLAPLAMAYDVNALAQKVKALFTKLDFNSPECKSQLNEIVDGLKELIQALQAAGRKDLWDTPEPKAKAEAAT